MKRKTQLDRAIEKLDAEIAILVAAKERLQREQAQPSTRKPRAPKPLPAKPLAMEHLG